ATFSGFPAASATVEVAAGKAVQRDFQLSPSGAVAEGATVRLDEFVVATSREMSGAALAINEQRYAPNMRNVVATDEFGDIAEGNVAEFLKFMPGVNIDYAGGNARDISLNGVPSTYVPVTLDGFGLASAVGGGAGGTARSVGLDQVSINNLSRIEVSFSPTPDSQGNALAGSVNLVPRSSFERVRPAGNFSTYLMLRDDIKKLGKTPAPRHPTRKIHPGVDFSYVAPVSRDFGFTLSGGFNRQYSGEPQILVRPAVPYVRLRPQQRQGHQAHLVRLHRRLPAHAARPFLGVAAVLDVLREHQPQRAHVRRRPREPRRLQPHVRPRRRRPRHAPARHHRQHPEQLDLHAFAHLAA
ncbi:MAG: hypothetical protein RLZZ221_1586, partial [Verrucomicrobiota bacterium]